MKNPQISILIPTYNAAHFLNGICASILAQTFQDFEVLIWDDGSTDETARVLANFSADLRFHIFRSEENRGLNRVWYELLIRAKGDFWCSPGADDLLFPDFLESRFARLRENPNAVLIHGAPQIIDEEGKPLAGFPLLMNLPRQMDGDRALQILLQHNIINQPSALVRTVITKKWLPLFQRNWKYAPDWYLWILHLSSGLDLLWESEPKHQYRVHSQSLSLGKSYSAVRRAEIRLVPLCALSAAATSSSTAAGHWRKWRKVLYALWLRRAWTLRKCDLLKQWLHLGAEAFYGRAQRQPSLAPELGKHALAIILNSKTEKQFLARQRFRVSGLAQIDDPIFR